ncbi:MAG TPA: biotin--[acetyl-CoA-carboxylase] ligase [Firmicutes bacterium]|nr:biotin--[acetyl-CoA-carboxylase] ligase [Bacillota bacterium]
MKPGLYLLAEDRSTLFSAADPAELAAAHPCWAKDLQRLEPWAKTVLPGKSANGRGMAAWRSGFYSADSASLVCGSCSSTMDALRYLIDELGLSPWDGLLAVEQKEGRGRRSHSWISPPGNLYVSWALPLLEEGRGTVNRWQAVASLLVGELTAAVLDTYGLKTAVKWPNDILVDDKKICGILVENRDGRTVVGVGLNLGHAPRGNKLKEPPAAEAASLQEVGVSVTPLELWFSFAKTGRRRYDQIVGSMSPEEFTKLLQHRLAWKGRTVLIKMNDDQGYLAEIKGLSPDGGLLIIREGKFETVYTGSIYPAG